MSNWAKLQEDLMGKPVFKRAKHGIHFQNNDDSITANFSGKPCHYEDGGIWKPIDTKLVLLPDGFYGCPHSKVKVHPDGRVAVAGTDYAQRVELPSAKTGLADGDKLIREFSFGKQEMRITEDGFKSEITLNRIPTLTEARKLIATESGWLSKQYLKSLTTATDANGNVHTVTTLTAFRTWLAGAKFPVVIDPDFSVTSTSGDGCLYSINTRCYWANDNFLEQKVNLIRFDCSSVAAGATTSAANIKFYKYSGAGTPNSANAWLYEVADANHGWVGTLTGNPAQSGQATLGALAADGSGGVTTAWASGGNFGTAGTDYIDTVLASYTANRSDNQYTEYTANFNASGIAVIDTWFGSMDGNNGLYLMGGLNNANLCTSNHVTSGYRPVLTVTYTAAGTFIPINMNAQMQSLTGGMRG